MAHVRSPIRVLFVVDRLHETGGTLWYLQTLPRLDRARVTPQLCVFAPRHPIASRFEAVGIRPTFFGRAKWDPRCLGDLAGLARTCEADLLHLAGWTSFLLGRGGVHLVGLPAILRFNCMLPLSPARSFLNRQLMSSRWPAIAVSEAVRTWSSRQFGLSPDRIAVLYNGHDIDRFASPPPGARDRIRREFGLGPGTPVIGLVGRIHTIQKGQDVMIEAMPALLRHRSDVVLLLVGDGPDRARCEALVRRLGIAGAVRFAGDRSDIPEILAAVDVAVVPSVCDEGLPFVAIEASAAGRPVVAFDSGGLTEIVVHEQTGIVVPKGDIARLAEAIARILNDPDLASRLSVGARRNALRFTMSRHLEELTSFYEAALEEQRRHDRKPTRGRREETTA
jgi:glycosyltransferase involved in cell wall biosynthesis